MKILANIIAIVLFLALVGCGGGEPSAAPGAGGDDAGPQPARETITESAPVPEDAGPDSREEEDSEPAPTPENEGDGGGADSSRDTGEKEESGQATATQSTGEDANEGKDSAPESDRPRAPLTVGCRRLLHQPAATDPPVRGKPCFRVP